MPNILKSAYFRIYNYQVNNYSKTVNPNLLHLLKTMPKEHKHIVEAQSQRLKIREKFSKYVPGRVTLQVLGTGAIGAPRSLYVFSDQSRYLFNCGEGTQRLAHEHKMKLAKLEHIFVTQPIWRNIGGLPGTALTIQDVGVPQITLHGPQGLEELFTATKRFVIIKDLKIKMASCENDVPFEDNVMTVYYVPLTKNVKKVVETIVDENSSDELETEIKIHGNDKEIQTALQPGMVDAVTSTRNEKRSRNRKNSKTRNEMKDDLIVEDDNIDYYAHERKLSRNRRRNRNRSYSRAVSGTRTSPEKISQTSQLLLQHIKERGVSMAYICKLKPRPGALNLEKCVEYGIQPGPLLGKLKSGQDITLDSGVVVKSKDVCDPDDPGPIFIVVDCPSEDYLDSLINNEIFQRHQMLASNDFDLADIVIHFTPKNILENSRYKQWVDKFSPSTHHLVLNDANTCMGSVSVHKIQHKLNILHNEMFPLLSDDGTQIVEEQKSGIPSTKKMKIESRSPSPIQPYIFANTFCSYHLRPKKGLDRSLELKLTPSEYIEETYNVEGFSDVLQELKQKLNDESKQLNIRPYPKILFLGTGSCIPNKTRNTSGILLETSENCNVLVDCGEGTYGQLVRFFGHERINKILVNVNAVYISHLHADHHIGLIGFLQGRRKALNDLKLNKNPILLFAPKQILTWLNFYDKCFENINREFELISNSDLILNDNKLAEGIKMRILNTLEMDDINTVFVKHCPNAFGVAFMHKSGYKITYSGDTMPCDSLVDLGQCSDVLIHEATMEDELSHEAIIKMHSTTSEAIDVGKKMKAKSIILTHFSQRYAKIPRFNDNFTANVGIAFDNMQVRLDELPLVPLLYPALRLMFAEHYEELEHKAVKRQLRIERQREASKERQ